MGARQPFLGEIWKCSHPECRFEVMVINEKIRESNYTVSPIYCPCSAVMTLERARPETDPGKRKL